MQKLNKIERVGTIIRAREHMCLDYEYFTEDEWEEVKEKRNWAETYDFTDCFVGKDGCLYGRNILGRMMLVEEDWK